MESPLVFRVVRAKKGPELDTTFIEATTESEKELILLRLCKFSNILFN